MSNEWMTIANVRSISIRGWKPPEHDNFTQFKSSASFSLNISVSLMESLMDVLQALSIPPTVKIEVPQEDGGTRVLLGGIENYKELAIEVGAPSVIITVVNLRWEDTGEAYDVNL